MKRIAFATLLALVTSAGTIHAQGDAMKGKMKDGAMKNDKMKDDKMKGDAMKDDKMSGGAMKNDKMGDGAMKHDQMAMSHPGHALFEGENGQRVAGGVTMSREGAIAAITLDNEFAMAQTPDAQLYLSATSARDASAVSVGRVKARSAGQRYVVKLPAAMQPHYVIVWSDRLQGVLATAKIDDTAK